MKKVVLIQSPSKLFEVVPIFYAEAEKLGFFDKFYIITDHPDPYGLGDNCHVVRQLSDNQFATNMDRLLEDVEEDVFFVCCEDHIMSDTNDVSKLDECFEHFVAHNNMGFLRLTHQEKAELASKKGFYWELKRSYKYYISLQPAIWRKPYFAAALRKGEDAWRFETEGAKRVRKLSGMKSYMVAERVFHNSNFFKEGNMYRRQFVDYAIKNDIKLNQDWKVLHKKKPISMDEYLRIQSEG